MATADLTSPDKRQSGGNVRAEKQGLNWLLLKCLTFENFTKIEDHINTVLGPCPVFWWYLYKEDPWDRISFIGHQFLLTEDFCLCYLPFLWRPPPGHFLNLKLSWPKRSGSPHPWIFDIPFFAISFPQITTFSFWYFFITVIQVNIKLSPMGVLGLADEFILWFDFSMLISEIQVPQERYCTTAGSHRS